MKEKYIASEFEIIEIEASDIVTASCTVVTPFDPADDFGING